MSDLAAVLLLIACVWYFDDNVKQDVLELIHPECVQPIKSPYEE